MRDLSKVPSAHKQKKKYPFLKIFILSFLFVAVLFGIVKFFNLDKNLLKGPRTVVKLITNSGLESDNNRINVLLLGTGGPGHDGPDLSDTMILASVDEDGKDVALVSIPRDLWAPPVNAKINAAYAYGQGKDGKGLDLVRETVSSLLGVPVHYTLRVDFDGFIKAVDLVGGLDIEIDNSFTDPHYPITGKEDDLCGLTLEKQGINGVTQNVVKTASGSAIPLSQINDKNDPFICRYETLNFAKGQMHLDGATTLKFVRSRYGTNNEGSDFARSARQEKIILAVRQKVFSSQTLTNPKTIASLIETFGASIDTDVVDEDVPLFAKLAQKIDASTIRRVVLDTGRDESQLITGDPQNYGGQYVLAPKGSWEDLGSYIQGEIFKLEEK